MAKKEPLSITHPELAKEWHPTKNDGLKPDEVTYGSNRKVWWKCDKGHEWEKRVCYQTKNKTSCPYCAGKLIGYGNDLQSQFPDLMNEWNYKKNKDINPKKVSPKSSQKVWWKCKNGHDFNSYINNRTRKIRPTGCPFCTSQTSYNELYIYAELLNIFETVENRKKINGKEIDIYIADLKTGISYDGYYWHKSRVKADILISKEFDKSDMNFIRVREKPLKKIGSHNILIGAKEESLGIVIKILEKLLSFNRIDSDLKRKIQLYNKNNRQTNRKAFNKFLSYLPGPLPGKSLKDLYPDIAQDWDFIKNEPLKPSMFNYGTSKKVWWLCDKGHSYYQTISHRTSKKSTGCPYCAGQKVGYGNDIETLFPKIAKEFHKIKNKGLKPNQFTQGSGKKVWWICKNRHEWLAAISQRTRGDGCPHCKSLEFLHPEILKFWNNKKNNQTPLELAPGSEKKVWWVCSQNHEFEMRINQFIVKPECPHCTQKRVGYGHDLATQYPALLKEWDYKKNKETPELYFPNSNKNVWWLCRNNHSYYVPIARRAAGSTCPYCSGHKVGYGNDLKTLYPKLVKEWDYSKNKKIKPENFRPKSHSKVWWICKKGHEWEAIIRTRVDGSGCPYCFGNKVGYGNDVKTLYPNLVNEWHKIKNDKLPSDFTAGSHKKVWWMCKNGHEWKSEIRGRTKRGYGCPKCRYQK